MFEWDRIQAQENLAKLGIDFRDALLIFGGSLVTVKDNRENYGERRFLALGLLAAVVVSVAYAERGKALRVISVRKAPRHEACYFLSQVGY